jgi:predicted ribosome quality control (RQC) complex YloA/Tae2 family protein
VLTLRELRRAAALVEQELTGARLVRAVQPDRFTLALVLESGGRGAPREKRALLLSVRPGLGRLSVLDEVPPAPETPGPLALFLRAHGVGARLAGASAAPGDRIVTLRFEGGEDPWSLRLSLMGARSNVYLSDGRDLLRMSLRPVEETRRDLALGEPWRDPEPRPRPEGDDRFADLPDPDFFAALEREAAEKARTGEAGDLAGELRRALRRRTQQLERKLDLLAEDLRAGERAAELEQAGELLKSNLARARKGASELWVEDPTSGARQAIPLDPALSPAANLEEIFRRYRKELRRASRAGEEMGALREQERRMSELSAAVEAAAAPGAEADALQEIAALPEVARLLSRARPQERAGEAPAKPRRRGPPGVPARLLPRRYRSATGLEIWVGRSDEGNDFLSTRLARGNDLFFHLDGSPGSHVVLRTEGRSDPPSEAVLEACELAVHFSKQRGSSRAAVHVAPIKNVKKPKGAKPGLVFVHGGRTVQLRHEPARLRRTLEARIEDAGE